MSRYGYFRALYMSFYSRDLYRDVGENWGAGTVLYLTLVLALSWLITIFFVYSAVHTSAAQFNQTIVPQLPSEIKIDKGILSTPQDKPYVIKDPQTQQTIAIIDTSGKYTTIAQSSAPLLITKTSVIHGSEPAADSTYKKIEINTIPTNVNMVITQSQVQQIALKIIDWMWVLVFPLFLLATLAYRLLQSIFYALLGKMFAVISGQQLMYSTILKLSLVSITPAIVLSTILGVTHRTFPHLNWVYFGLAMIYLIFAIRANKSMNRINK